MVASGMKAQEWMDGETEGRKNVVAKPVIMYELWWRERVAGMKMDQPLNLRASRKSTWLASPTTC